MQCYQHYLKKHEKSTITKNILDQGNFPNIYSNSFKWKLFQVKGFT